MDVNYLSIITDIFLSHIHSDHVAVLATSGTPFTKAKGLWQVTQKQKMVDDLVNEFCTSNSNYF